VLFSAAVRAKAEFTREPAVIDLNHIFSCESDAASREDRALPGSDEKVHFLHRCAPPLIRRVFAQFRSGAFNAAQAHEQLELSKTRFYEMYADYLRAWTQRSEHDWTPAFPVALMPRPGQKKSRSFCANAFPADRLAPIALPSACWIKIGRAQVRRWAIENGLAHITRTRKEAAPVHRWQRPAIGELWQLDATPHRWS
jgi:hypothetical protein